MYSLPESAEFARGFSPTSHSMRVDDDGALRIAFVPDGEERAVAVRVTQDDAGELRIEGGAETQVRRILGLDVDDGGFAAVGERDPVVAELQRRWPGFRPISFPTPFEAGMWFLISQRTHPRHALAIKEQLAQTFGEAVDGITGEGSPSTSLWRWPT